MTFNYTAFDGTTAVSSTATIDLTPVNDAPVATPVTLTASNEDQVRVITTADLLAGVTDIDTAGGTQLFTLAVQTGGGSLVDNGNGTWSYTPGLNDHSQVTLRLHRL